MSAWTGSSGPAGRRLPTARWGQQERPGGGQPAAGAALDPVGRDHGVGDAQRAQEAEAVDAEVRCGEPGALAGSGPQPGLQHRRPSSELSGQLVGDARVGEGVRRDRGVGKGEHRVIGGRGPERLDGGHVVGLGGREEVVEQRGADRERGGDVRGRLQGAGQRGGRRRPRGPSEVRAHLRHERDGQRRGVLVAVRSHHEVGHELVELVAVVGHGLHGDGVHPRRGDGAAIGLEREGEEPAAVGPEGQLAERVGRGADAGPQAGALVGAGQLRPGADAVVDRDPHAGGSGHPVHQDRGRERAADLHQRGLRGDREVARLLPAALRAGRGDRLLQPEEHHGGERPGEGAGAGAHRTGLDRGRWRTARPSSCCRKPRCS